MDGAYICRICQTPVLMDDSTMIGKNSESCRFCVIIPTYNNAATLSSVISDVLLYCRDVIVVNDGSTDETDSILRSFNQIHCISYKQNRGKGWAMRKGFELAVEKKYDYAITLDSDGQHFAKDIPAFLTKLTECRSCIIIGSRNMNQNFVPGKSSFGNKFSNFWFKVETGIDCPDTQSGYRLYPLYLLKNFHFITRKYEFEIEVLVSSVWKGIKIDSIPISIFYAPKESRISHFRPFKDFFRISILNTILVLITFFYIRPKNFVRSLFQKNIRQFLYSQFFQSKLSDRTKALSVALGVFMGILPIWGFQLIAAIALAILFRLNKPLVIIAANISIPPMIPLILFASYKAGAWWMGTNASEIIFDKNLTIHSIGNHLVQYIYGSITLAVIAAFVFGFITFTGLKLFKKKKR